MFWWHHAAQLVASGQAQRFGLITTNSLKQTFNRRVVEAALKGAVPKPVIPAKVTKGDTKEARHSGLDPESDQRECRASSAPLDSGVRRNDGMREVAREGGFHLAFAIPDHPWVDSADGAAVRIAMTVGAAGASGEGRLLNVTDEREGKGEGLHVTLLEQNGLLHADLRIGANVAAAKALAANSGLASRGFQLIGAGFIVSPEEATRLEADAPIKPYRNGRDLTERPRGVKVIDLYGLSTDEVRARFPATYQWVLERVKPERDQNARAGYRNNWWIFGEARRDLRSTLVGLPRYVATVETAKHRAFQFLAAEIAADNKLVCIALSDAFHLGVLSSHTHVAWALATGSTLEDRPVYVKTAGFEKFPFPAATPEQTTRIRDLAEQLDAHRKRQQAAHETLTLTGMYNVLEKLKSGEALTAKEKVIHEHGLVSVLKTLHDELDAAVLAAYGWGDLAPLLADAAQKEAASETLLVRLVALNAERAAEEAKGQIRWLRPEYQHPAGKPTNAGAANALAEEADQDAATGDDTTKVASTAATPRDPWPASLPEQVAAVARVLAASSAPLTLADLAARFTGKGPWKKRLPQIIDTLEALGRARRDVEGRVVG
jgi:hypothetical protein